MVGANNQLYGYQMSYKLMNTLARPCWNTKIQMWKVSKNGRVTTADKIFNSDVADTR